MEIKDSVFVITGVSKGIGHALARLLTDAGGKVAGWGRTKPVDISSERFRFFECDVRKMPSVENAFNGTMDSFGRIDGLVNNAGLGYFGLFEELDPAKWKELYEVNVYGIYHTCRYVIPVMKKQQKGHIINISSIAGLEGMPQVAAYCGAKHAVRGITESLFKELRDYGIKVTGIYPGTVKTNFFDEAGGNIRAHDQMTKPEEVALQIVRALDTSDNFAVNSIEFRPLQPKPKA